MPVKYLNIVFFSKIALWLSNNIYAVNTNKVINSSRYAAFLGKVALLIPEMLAHLVYDKNVFYCEMNWHNLSTTHMWHNY